jgi:hypothetical protein
VVAAAVEGVEGAGVLAVQVPHALREVRFGCLDEEVVVVPEQAAGVEPPSVPADHAAQLVEEDAAIVVVEEAQSSVVAAGRHVVPGAGGEVTSGTGHAATVARPCSSGCVRDELGTRSLRRRHVPGTSGGRRAASSRGMSVGCRRSVRPAAWVACRVRPRQVRPRLVPGTRHGSRGDVGFGPASARGLGQPRGPLRLCRTARGVERLTRLTPRPWSARGAGATGSSPDPEAACAGRACPCGWSRGTGRHRRRGHRPRSAPR